MSLVLPPPNYLVARYPGTYQINSAGDPVGFGPDPTSKDRPDPDPSYKMYLPINSVSVEIKMK
jgi:hypothetical protein